MSQAPQPGWYADPQGLPAYRWWDGQSWTEHTTAAQQTTFAAPAAPAAPAVPAYAPAQYSGFGTPPAAYAPDRTAPYQPASKGSDASRNQYAFITLGVVALYVLLAWKAHIYILGIVPVVMSIRSKTRGEPLAVLAVIAAAAAVLVSVLGLTHHGI